MKDPPNMSVNCVSQLCQSTVSVNCVSQSTVSDHCQKTVSLYISDHCVRPLASTVSNNCVSLTGMDCAPVILSSS